MFRALNALCYLISGVVLVAFGHSEVKMVLFGLAMLGYGLYVGLSRRPYWVSTVTYLIPVVGVAWAITSVNH